jgi:hypothetical protein
VTKEPDQKIDPGFVIRARLRRSVLYVESGRCRNPNELAQSRQIAKRQLERAVEEVVEWAKLCQELGVND